MKYFSGFCLENESELFKSFTCKGDFCIVGFSYGAQKALEYAFTCKEKVPVNASEECGHKTIVVKFGQIIKERK